jgi:transposase-like protein
MNKNKYLRNGKVSEYKFRLVIKYFLMDFTATDTSELIELNRNTINRIFNLIRENIFKHSNVLDNKKTPIEGEFELDESYFGANRVRGKRGRGAGGKTIVFGLLKRGGKVYTEIVEDVKARSLIPIIRGKIDIRESTIHTDGWRAYDGLVDLGYNKHYRVHHGKNEFVRGKSHINGIESFWGYTKRRLQKFNGIKKDKFEIYLKESEWRFNHRNKPIDERIKIIQSMFRSD